MGEPSSNSAPSVKARWPRLMSVGDAAEYVGISVRTFEKGVGETWPEPIRHGGRKLFDRDALDRAVDALTPSRPQSPRKIFGGEGQDHGSRSVEAR